MPCRLRELVTKDVVGFRDLGFKDLGFKDLGLKGFRVQGFRVKFGVQRLDLILLHESPEASRNPV